MNTTVVALLLSIQTDLLVPRKAQTQKLMRQCVGMGEDISTGPVIPRKRPMLPRNTVHVNKNFP